MDDLEQNRPPADGITLAIDFRKVLISSFILWQIFAVTIWLMPPGATQEQIAQFVRPYMLATGCWQAWTMFSPEPASLDAYVAAEIDYADGTHRTWLFPRMSQTGYIQRYRRERFRKMMESAHLDDNKRMWPFLARYAAIENDRAGDPRAYPMTVHLIRHYRYIGPPPDGVPPYDLSDFYDESFNKSPLPHTWSAPS